METIKRILALISELTAIGIPPGITDEKAFRAWLGQLAEVIATCADFTPAQIDDGAVAIISAAIESDAVWEALYAMLTAGLHEPPKAMGDAHAEVIAAAVGMDPATIVMIISAVLEIIKAWRNR